METNQKRVAKYPFGTKVLINNNVVGIVLSSWEMCPNDLKHREFFYRIIVDHTDLAYRVVNKHVVQTEQHLFDEDFTTLFCMTNNIGVIERAERDLAKYKDDIDFETILEEIY